VIEFKKSAARPSAAEDRSTVHPPCAVSDAIWTVPLPEQSTFVLGQRRRFGSRPTTSDGALETDIVTAGRHVSKVPGAVVLGTGRHVYGLLRRNALASRL